MQNPEQPMSAEASLEIIKHCNYWELLGAFPLRTWKRSLI